MLASGQCIGSPQKRFCKFGLEIGVVTATLSAATTALFVGPAGIRHALLRIRTSRRQTCARARTHTHARTPHTGTRTHAARYTRTHHAARHDIPVGWIAGCRRTFSSTTTAALARGRSASSRLCQHASSAAAAAVKTFPPASAGGSARPPPPARTHARTHARDQDACLDELARTHARTHVSA